MKKRCLFTYEILKPGEGVYSLAGLKSLARGLAHLNLFPYSQNEQLEMARQMVKKISIQGIQPKFSAVLSVKNKTFETTGANGRFIMKPQVPAYKQLPENEDLTMHLIAMAGVQVPWHGLIKCADGSLSYVVKRFDRSAKEKIPMEDFAQLTGASRDTKYDVSLERVVEVIEKYCTYPTLEYLKLYQRVILAFLFGNEDFHLKNLSLITVANKVQLSPAYDFLNSTIVNPGAEEEMALSIGGKKKGFTRDDLLKDFAEKVLFLPRKKVEKETSRLLGFTSDWEEMIKKSFLSKNMQVRYVELLKDRASRLS